MARFSITLLIGNILIALSAGALQALADPGARSGNAHFGLDSAREQPDPSGYARRPGAAQYLIITAEPLVGAFHRFAAWKTRSGVPAEVLTLASIRRQHRVAADDAERIRRAIRDAHAAGTRWVLLGGDTEVIPTRIVHSAFMAGLGAPADYESDMYFSCLDGTWNADGDGFYGEGYVSASDPGDDPDLIPEVFVGRAPVRTAQEAQRFVDKTIDYEQGLPADFENTVLCFAEVLFPYPWHGEPHPLDGAGLVQNVLPILGEIGRAHV